MLPTENYKEDAYKEDAPIDSPSPASGTCTAIVLKEHNKDLQPETDIGKKTTTTRWTSTALQMCQGVFHIMTDRAAK